MKRFIFIPLILFMVINSCGNSDEYNFEIRDKKCPGFNVLLKNLFFDIKEEKYPYLKGFFDNLDYDLKRKIIEVSVRFLEKTYNIIKSNKLLKFKFDSTFNIFSEDTFKLINEIRTQCNIFKFLQVLSPLIEDCDFEQSILNIINEKKIDKFLKDFTGKNNPSENDYKSLLSLLLLLFSNPDMPEEIPFIKDYNDKDFNLVSEKLKNLVLINKKRKKDFTTFFSCLNSLPNRENFLSLLSTTFYSAKIQINVFDLKKTCSFLKKTATFLLTDLDAYPTALKLFNKFYTYYDYKSLVNEVLKFLKSQGFLEIKSLFEDEIKCR